MVRWWVLVLVALTFPAAGCGTGADSQAVRRAAPEGAAEYRPPGDGLLTEAQMQTYLAVHRRETEILQKAAGQLQHLQAPARGEPQGSRIGDGLRTLDAAGALLHADVQAAQELGVNAAEYQWIRERVRESLAADARAEFERATSAAAERAMAYYRRQLAEAGTEEDRRLWMASIDSLAARQAALRDESAGTDTARRNRETVARYRGQLDQLAGTRIRVDRERKP